MVVFPSGHAERWHENNMKRRYFYTSTATGNWAFAWALGTITCGLALYLNDNLYFIYCYLYLAGSLSLINIYSKYAAIDKNSLYLYYGVQPFKNVIEIPWEKIAKADVIEYQRMVSGGGIGPRHLQDYKGIQINLKTPISELDRKKIIKKESWHLFELGMEVSDSGKSLLIREGPHRGFKAFIESFPIRGELSANLTIPQRVSKPLIVFNALNLILFVFCFALIIKK